MNVTAHEKGLGGILFFNLAKPFKDKNLTFIKRNSNFLSNPGKEELCWEENINWLARWEPRHPNACELHKKPILQRAQGGHPSSSLDIFHPTSLSSLLLLEDYSLLQDSSVSIAKYSINV